MGANPQYEKLKNPVGTSGPEVSRARILPRPPPVPSRWKPKGGAFCVRSPAADHSFRLRIAIIAEQAANRDRTWLFEIPGTLGQIWFEVLPSAVCQTLHVVEGLRPARQHGFQRRRLMPLRRRGFGQIEVTTAGQFNRGAQITSSNPPLVVGFHVQL